MLKGEVDDFLFQNAFSAKLSSYIYLTVGPKHSQHSSHTTLNQKGLNNMAPRDHSTALPGTGTLDQHGNYVDSGSSQFLGGSGVYHDNNCTDYSVQDFRSSSGHHSGNQTSEFGYQAVLDPYASLDAEMDKARRITKENKERARLAAESTKSDIGRSDQISTVTDKGKKTASLTLDSSVDAPSITGQGNKGDVTTEGSIKGNKGNVTTEGHVKRKKPKPQGGCLCS